MKKVDSAHELYVQPVPSALRRDALAMVLADVAGDRREEYIASVLAAEQEGRWDLGGLLEARQGTELAGAIWTYPQPGHVATIWPPVTRGPAEELAADLLLIAADAWLARRDTRIAQALLPADAPRHQLASMQGHGYEHLADLLYMVCLSGQFPQEKPKSVVQFQSVPTAEHSRLGLMIERTYERTLDCPRLNGVRAIDDVLAGYRACGKFDEKLWMIASTVDGDIGCVLLADHPADDQFEIVYAGLVPEARGRNYGLAMARKAQWLTRVAGRSRLVLAVDAANAPAVKMYERAGFVMWDRRRALVRVFPDGGA